MNQNDTMNGKHAILTLLLTLFVCSCKDSVTVVPAEDGRMLNAASVIAAEIETKHAIECDPYMRSKDGVALIEFNATDPELDHESLASQVSKLKSVQSFDGELHLVFRSAVSDSGTVKNLGLYHAKTGQRIQP